MSDTLSILFGSPARVRLLRLFLFNTDKSFTFDEICKRLRLVRRTARTEVTVLEKAGVIKSEMVEVKVKNKLTKVLSYVAETDIPEFKALQTFMFATTSLDGKNLLSFLKKTATVDFLVVAGVFVQDFESRLDILIAQKKITLDKIETAIHAFEAEVGVEVRFSVLTSDDLIFRADVNDKLIRDIFDYKHQIILDKLNISDS